MFNMPNMITLVRLPLAICFLQESVSIRVGALILAMLSDCLDGFIARRLGKVSHIGKLLDPLADKFFVFCVLSIFLLEKKIELWQAAAMLCRDLSLLLFGCYLVWKGNLQKYKLRAIICGKITTSLQFIVFLGLLLHIKIPLLAYFGFVFLGACALLELYFRRTQLAG